VPQQPAPPARHSLQVVEERLAQATSPQEVLLWTQVRAEILRQDDFVKEQEHRRRMEKIPYFSA
jgi:hypothetical protein